MKKLINRTAATILTTMILVLTIVTTTSAQSFILDLEANPMSFKETNRTVIVNNGNNGESEGSVHKYVDVVTKDGITVYAHLTILEMEDAWINTFDDDAITGDIDRFQPRIGTSTSNGGQIVYQLEFFDTDTDNEVFLTGYYMTAVDIDGNSNSNREYVQVGGYSSYEIDQSSQLVISTDQTSGRTQFKGRTSSLSGVTFDNTAAFITYFTNPNNKITFALGQTRNNNVRYYSVRFGAPGGVFSNPNIIYNPLPIAIDDIGTPINTTTGGTAVSNVLTNDVFEGDPIVASDVTISLVTPASNSGVQLNIATGEVTVDPGTPVGDYQMTYKICMNSNPNNCDIAIIYVSVVEFEADIAVVKTASSNSIEAGQALLYTITVTNNGPDDAENVTMNDILDGNLSLISTNPETGTWVDPIWTIGTIANGESYILEIVAETSTTFSGDITNTATASSTTNDPDATNNSSSVTITVTPSAPVINLYPATGPGTLAFEDLWPGKGDYDFNDLVVDYQFNITMNSTNMVENIVGTFTIKAFGAGLENGFGFQLPSTIDPADVTVTGSSLTESYISLSGNGTESGQSSPTIIVFDNSYNEMNPPGGAIGVNTTPNITYVTPKTITINISVSPNKYSYTDLDISNFNPFLIVNLTRGHEIHLPNFAPTDLVDESLFGTSEDASDPSANIYYKTATNLPWAINIYESFDYPIEKQDITGAHLKFGDWATSGGSAFPDWYKDESGYRNESLIYTIPNGN